jgi:hypothetical protein
VGDVIEVNLTGSDTSFNVEAEDGVTVNSVPSSTTFTYLQPGFPDVGTPVKTVLRYEGTSTIVTTTNHGLASGSSAVLTIPLDISFNGTFNVTNVNNTTLTYPQSSPDDPPDVLANNVTKWQRTGGTTTLTTGTGGVTVGSYVLVHLSDTSFSGKFQVTAVTASTLQYAQPGSPDVPLTTAPGGTKNTYDSFVPITTYSRSGNVATITTSVAHGLKAGDDPIVDVSNSSFNGTFPVVTVVSPTQFTYANSGPNVAATTGIAGDGVTGKATKGTAIDMTGTGAMVVPGTTVTTGSVMGPPVNVSGTGGQAAGPLFEIFHVDPTQIVGASATAPVEYAVPAGTSATLNPGTYYGGLCIGAPVGTHCGPKVGGTCATSSATYAKVTLNPGIYIMAGGGFYVCGNTEVDASSGVLIYNTVDHSALAALAGQLDQVEVNTNQPVTLKPLPSGIYAGLAVYQGGDPGSAASPNPPLQLSGSKCDGRSTKLTDIALLHAGGPGLAGFSGTIYAPASYALFTDAVSGISNMAVMTGCIYIAGANATFNFDGGGLFGTSVIQFLGEW